MNSTLSYPSRGRPRFAPYSAAVMLVMLVVSFLLASAARADTWVWSMSGIHGGGLGQVIATDPYNANSATLGGDSWGVYNTTDAGNTWHAATKGLGVVNDRDPQAGDFFYMGVEYSRKYPGRVYALGGKLNNPGAGNFGYITGNTYTVVTRAINGGESQATGGLDGDHPRPTGKRVVIDYDTSTTTEWIYVGTGNGGGVARSNDAGTTWTTIGLSGLGSAITGMCLDPSDTTTLYVSTRGNKAYRLTNIRGSATVTQLTAAPNRVEEVSTIGSSVYAAAGTSGIYKLTSNGTVWTALGGTTFTSTGSAWSAIGGTGNIIYVGCSGPSGEKSIAKSIDGGSTWNWVTSPVNVSLQVWGRSEDWWLGIYQSRVVPGNGGTYETTQIEVDKFNSDIVYSCGRSGAWKSEDGGATWRPAMNGLGGTMHSFMKADTSGGAAWTDDEDWKGETTSDNWATVTQQNPPSFSSAKITLTKGGHTYALVRNAIRDFTVDGVSIADEFFKATCVRGSDIDVSSDGNYIYVAQYGGGVIIGHKTTVVTPTVTIAATVPTAGEPSTNGQFTLTCSPAPASAITVNLLVGGTATNGTDYSTIGSTVTIGTSGTTTVAVNVIDDTLAEGDETVDLSVQSGTGYTVGPAFSATVTIADNESGSSVGPFTAEDIGAPAIAGSSSLSGTVYTVAGAGTDIFGTSDQFQFAHENWNGDGSIIARVTQVQNTHNFSKAAVMFRGSVVANAKEVSNSLLGGTGVQMNYRTNAGSTTTTAALVSGFAAPYWVRLDRQGNTFTGYDSPDGQVWFLTGTTTFTMPTAAQVGLAVTSHNVASLNTSKFDHVSVAPLQSWTSDDVGTPGAAGSASFDPTTGIYTLIGSGANIWTNTDAFQFYDQSWTGDAVLIAEVKSVQNTSNFAKAGIMIRQSLAVDSANAIIDVTPAGGIEFNRRLNNGDTTTAQTVVTGLTAPYFIKLVRSGDNISAYRSPDGATWTQVGTTVSIPMTGDVYVGLVDCSHAAGTLNTSTFDSVFFTAP